MPSIVSAGNLLAANAQTLTQNQNVQQVEWLTCIFRVGSVGTPATAAGDANGLVIAYLEDGVTLAKGNLSPDQTNVAVLSGGVSEVIKRYRIGGIGMVAIKLLNNNATTALPGQVDYFIS